MVSHEKNHPFFRASESRTVFAEDTAERVGINRHAPGRFKKSQDNESDNYYSLANPPARRPGPESDQWAASIYNGIVPAKNIARRDFAVNGAVVSKLLFLPLVQCRRSHLKAHVVHVRSRIHMGSRVPLGVVLLPCGQDGCS